MNANLQEQFSVRSQKFETFDKKARQGSENISADQTKKSEQNTFGQNYAKLSFETNTSLAAGTLTFALVYLSSKTRNQTNDFLAL